MSRDKQMYNDLIEIFDEEYNKRYLITPQNTAEKLTAKGYRKASEVALEVLVELEAKINQMKPHKVYNDKSRGDSPKSEREHAMWDVIDMIHEIAEKYTEGGE